MTKGASRLMNIIKQTGEKMSPQSSQIASLVVKSLSPLTFKVDDKLDITEEFCVFNKHFNKSKLRVNDVITALIMSDGQRYFIQQNDTITDVISTLEINRGTITITPSAADTPTGQAVTWETMSGIPTVICSLNSAVPRKNCFRSRM